jgi:ATP-binding cassette, subfamily C, bacterial
MALITLLTIVVTLLDGIGLALIVPMVEIIVGIDNGTSEISLKVEAVFEWFGMTASIGTLVAVILVVQAVRVVGLATQLWLINLLGARFERNLRMGVYAAILNASWLHFTSQKSGELTNVLIPQSQRGGAMITAYTNAGAALITTIIYLAGAMLISWDLSLVAAAFTLVLAFALSYFFTISRKLGTKISDALRDMSVESQETIGGMKAIKSAGLEADALHRFRRISDELARQLSLNGANQGAMHSAGESLFMVAMVLGLLFATSTLGLAPSALLLFALLFLRMFQRAKGLQSSLLEFFQLAPSLGVLQSARQSALENASRQGGAKFTGLGPGMKLSDVSFTYPGRANGLNKVSINVPSGDSIAIVGSSGAGKTTIIDLIVGLIDPSSGNIRVGEQLLTDVSLNSWRTNIAYVTQGTVLFNDTLANNISLGHEHPDLDMLATVSQQSGIDQFISELPDGYNTVIGERGVRLSGGQRQRIALARALYRQPQLLILDEATSELDNHSERLFQETIDQLHGDLTILMVAHRLSTVMNVDNIYVLDQGKIVESGRPSELIEAQGIFHAMVNEGATETNASESPDSLPDGREPD